MRMSYVGMRKMEDGGGNLQKFYISVGAERACF